jgi:AcrR family transcriptional regulator
MSEHLPSMSGRRKQAALNDDRILAAAREVFIDDPEAPVSAVAARAGVGISALYRRYPSKEEMLARLCADGIAIYIAEADRALADKGDPWVAYTGFLRRIVAEDTHSLSTKLAGTFTPTEEHMTGSQRLRERGEALFDRTMKSGALRPDVTFLDVAFLLELVAETRLSDRERTAELRQRFLTLIIDGLRPGATTRLPGRPPTWDEQNERWIPK